MKILMLKDHSGYKAGEVVQVDGGLLEMIIDDGAGVEVQAPITEPVKQAAKPKRK